jgi:small multidrug resistance pump
VEEKRKGLGPQMVGLLIYVCLSATGLTLIKIGLNKNSTMILAKAGFSLSFSWILILGMCLYILSFLTSLLVMKGVNLSLYYPLSAGLIYIVVCVLSVLVLKEKLTISQLIGMAIIFAGIIVMNIGKGN